MSFKVTASLAEREAEVSDIIEEYASLTGIDANLVRGLITQESRFRRDAVSPTGAYGYGQFTRIGAAQIREVAKAKPDWFGNLSSFTKKDASDPHRGIPAIFAFLWWLLEVKYRHVKDPRTKLEAALTYYNAGGIPASLIVKYGSLERAKKFIEALPAHRRSQAHYYAEHVLNWAKAWKDWYQQRVVVEEDLPADVDLRILDEISPSEEELMAVEPVGSVDTSRDSEILDVRYRALVEALRLLDEQDDDLRVVISSVNGMTEVTLLIPGEMPSNV